MKIKFTQVIIGIIVCLALVSFLTDCGGKNKNPFVLLFTKLGIISSETKDNVNSEWSKNKNDLKQEWCKNKNDSKNKRF